MFAFGERENNVILGEIMKRTAIRIVCVACTVCLIAAMFASCFSNQQKSLLDDVADLVNAITYNESDKAYPYVKNIISEDNFPDKFAVFHEMLKDSGYYRVSVVNFTSTTNDGVTTNEGTFGLYTQNNGNFVILASKKSNIDGFETFKIAPDTENILPIPEDWKY